MKKLKAILFLIIYLVSVTECTQVLKLPLLFSHYTEHAMKEKDHSFLDFLKGHYITDDGVVSDDDTDRRLPFKEASSPDLDLDFVLLSNSVSCKPCPHSTVASPVFKEYLFYSLYIPGIWQPPKIS